MKINANIQIVGKSVILVPYRKEHVLAYHEWMKSEELQKFTCSEPLSLEEEYTMQQSWLNDEDKCTFILIDKSCMQDENNNNKGMCGDVNIFLSRDDETGSLVGELEVMVAEEHSRCKGIATEAALLMMDYGIKVLHISRFVAKIVKENLASLHMFQKSLHFQLQQYVPVFEQFEYALDVTLEQNKRFIEESSSHAKQIDFSFQPQ